MRYLTPLLCLIAFPVFLFAQSNYKPGYVVTAKGDTVKGFIDYREWDATPASFSFKHSLDDNNVFKYGPGDVNRVNINTLESFEVYTGRVSMDAVDPNRVNSERDTSFKIATIFLKVIEKGDKVALYSYKDDLKLRLFIGDAPGFNPEELVYRVTRTTTENTFQKQLSALALKYNELNDGLETYIGRSEYSEDNILGIVSRINHISKSDINKTHFNGPALNFFVGASAFINTTSPAAGSPYVMAGGVSGTSILPQISTGINLFANPATRALQFRLEVAAGFIQYKSLYQSKVYPYVPTEATYNSTALSASPQIIYNFYNTENFKVFVGLGMVLYHFSYSNAYFGAQDHQNSQVYIPANNFFQLESFDNAFILRAGIQFSKHVAIIGSYLTAVNNTNGGYFALSSTSTQIGLNYFFN